ncbi:MAG: FAD-dependent oxidoreductase, partial [Anaerolineae bacterium]|nr:FAD-dependent oxidoreductase [Anaerolineae bacterium]
MVDLARFFLRFTQEESCGKCLPCRLGTRAMLETLERICAGEGREGDIEYLQELGEEIRRSALCGLGQTAPNPVLTSIRYFRAEYEAHIRDRRCPAGACQALVRAPCQNACPAGMDVPGYVSLVGEGRFAEALATILDTNPFPSVCGRVCTHQCEARCRRAQLDQAVAIRQLKRFVGDHNPEWRLPPPASRDGGPKVGIVGAGPAGLSCAYFLARLGYRPTVFEKLPVAGGMLAVGIPEYRLPRSVLREEIERIAALGVEIRTNTPVGDGLTLRQLLEQGYQALFVAVGAHRSRALGIPGEELRGVVHATSFLRAVSLGGDLPPVAGSQVAVIGGGNAAVDAARTALRLGARQVTILYRRTRAEMPALREEIEAALAEGVAIEELAAPVALVGEDEVVRAVECQRMSPGPFDSSGRRRPVPDEGARFLLPADLVIPAIGQQAEAAALFADLGIETGADGMVSTDEEGRTSVPGVYAGGDAVTGPATVIEAIAAGRRAAMAIDHFLGGDAAPW